MRRSRVTSRPSETSFAGDPGRDIVLEDAEPEGGFVVRKPASPAVSLTVAPHLEAAAMGCHYGFMSTSGLPPREHCFDLCSPVSKERPCR